MTFQPYLAWAQFLVSFTFGEQDPGLVTRCLQDGLACGHHAGQCVKTPSPERALPGQCPPWCAPAPPGAGKMLLSPSSTRDPGPRLERAGMDPRILPQCPAPCDPWPPPSLLLTALTAVSPLWPQKPSFPCKRLWLGTEPRLSLQKR